MTQKDILKLLDKYRNMPIDKHIKKICGKKIGSGCYRDVYELKFDKRYVVKVETKTKETPVANVMEWMNYTQAAGSPLQKYLCPPLCLHPTGQILIMRKCMPAKSKEGLPKSLPACITDNKIENWGFIGKRPYIFDYTYLIPDQKMKKAKYWSLND